MRPPRCGWAGASIAGYTARWAELRVGAKFRLGWLLRAGRARGGSRALGDGRRGGAIWISSEKRGTGWPTRATDRFSLCEMRPGPWDGLGDAWPGYLERWPGLRGIQDGQDCAEDGQDGLNDGQDREQYIMIVRRFGWPRDRCVLAGCGTLVRSDLSKVRVGRMYEVCMYVLNVCMLVE